MNWTAVKSVFQCAALAAVIFFMITLSMAVHTAEKHISATLMDVDATLTKVNGKNGTLSQLDKVLTDTRLIVSHSDRLMTQQQASLVKLDHQASATIAALNETLISVKQTSDITAQSEQSLAQATVNAVDNLQPSMVSLNEELVQMRSVTINADKMLADTDATVLSIKVTTDDIGFEVNKLVHPTKKRMGFWATMGAGLLAIKKYAPIPSIF